MSAWHTSDFLWHFKLFPSRNMKTFWGSNWLTQTRCVWGALRKVWARLLMHPHCTWITSPCTCISNFHVTSVKNEIGFSWNEWKIKERSYTDMFLWKRVAVQDFNSACNSAILGKPLSSCGEVFSRLLGVFLTRISIKTLIIMRHFLSESSLSFIGCSEHHYSHCILGNLGQRSYLQGHCISQR